MSVVVLKAGLLTTVQDRGRRGFAAIGVGHAGPMDAGSFRLANALVGNADSAAALEVSLLGPRLRFETDATIALAGARFDMRIDAQAASSWQPTRIKAGSVLDLGSAQRGARAYLAVAGGFAVDAVLGSRSTDVNAGLGSLSGRALAAGERLSISTTASLASDPAAAPLRGSTRNIGASPSKPRRPTPSWSLDPRPWFDAVGNQPIRLIRGAHWEALDADSRVALFTQEFRIGADSNRVGYRLEGPCLALDAALELVSEAVAFGTLQLPPNGQPIALMAEHPTTGGYPRIGQIAAIDLPRLAQRRPGDYIRFLEMGIDEAQTRYLARERELAHLLDVIATRIATHD
ncbi:MAG: biotin-dependent carboxyltransferase family protein [Dokdonella sp.]